MKNIIPCFILFFLILSCNQKTENKSVTESNADQQIEIFWDWFVKNEKRFSKVEMDKDLVLSEISNNSVAINSELAFEIMQDKNDDFILTISADGVRKLIPIVEKIVEKSPKIKGWKFIAFRQKNDKALSQEIYYLSENLKVEPAKMKFLPITENNRLELIIYIDGINDENYDGMFYGGSVLLDNLVGEYQLMTKVDNYDFHNMPSQKKDLKQLKPISELPEYLDEYKPI